MALHPSIPGIPGKYIDAAIEKGLPPVPDSQYLNQALDLVKQGKALVNPVASGLAAVSSKTSEIMGAFNHSDIVDPSNPDLSLTNLVTGELFGGIKSGLAGATAVIPSLVSMTDRMLTSTHPFAGQQLIPEAIRPRNYVRDSSGRVELDENEMPKWGRPKEDVDHLGVPQVSTLFSVSSSQQALDASLGRNQDNPCSAISSTIGGMISSVSDATSYVTDALGSAYDTAKNWVSDIYSGATTGIGAIVASIKASVGQIIDFSVEGIAAVKAMIGSAIASAQATIGAVMGAVNEAITGAIGKVQEMAASVIGAIRETAAAIVEQVQAGFASMLKSLASTNPCAQGILLGEQGVLSNDMADLVTVNMPPGSEVK